MDKEAVAEPEIENRSDLETLVVDLVVLTGMPMLHDSPDFVDR